MVDLVSGGKSDAVVIFDGEGHSERRAHNGACGCIGGAKATCVNLSAQRRSDGAVEGEGEHDAAAVQTGVAARGEREVGGAGRGVDRERRGRREYTGGIVGKQPEGPELGGGRKIRVEVRETDGGGLALTEYIVRRIITYDIERPDRVRDETQACLCRCTNDYLAA